MLYETSFRIHENVIMKVASNNIKFLLKMRKRNKPAPLEALFKWFTVI